MPKVSIVIPVYNGVTFVDKCISSILKQTYTDFEVILVDDESIDDSLMACREWEIRDKRVQVHASVHQGAAGARHMGVLASKGEYITFVDIDDWVESTWLADLVAPFYMDSSIDIVVGGCFTNDLSGRVISSPSIHTPCYMGQEEALAGLMHPELWSGGCSCMKLYQRKFLLQVKPHKELSNGEDFALNWDVFRLAKRIYDIGRGGYHYVRNSASATHRINPKSYMACFAFASSILRSQEAQNSKKIKRALLEWILYDWHRLISLLYYELTDNESDIRELHQFFHRNFHSIFAELPQTPFIRHECNRFDNLSGINSYDVYGQEWEKIKKHLLEGRKVFLYGTGIYAQMIRAEFEKRNLCFDGYVVSDGQAYPELSPNDTHVVCYYSDLSVASRSNTVLFLTMNCRTSAAIYNRIVEDGFREIFLW
ncbi:MAG: glycosyltransferase family 2 protein [Mitsuokella sp.]